MHDAYITNISEINMHYAYIKLTNGEEKKEKKKKKRHFYGIKEKVEASYL